MPTVSPNAAAVLDIGQCLPIVSWSDPTVVVTSLIGIIAAVIALWGIYSQRIIASRMATLEHIRRQESDNDIIKARKIFLDLSNSQDGIARWANKDFQASDEATAIRTILNDYEIISIGIQKGIIDYEIYKMWNRKTTISYWDRASSYIVEARRINNNQLLFHEFEQLKQWLDDKEKPPKRGKTLGKFI